MKKNSKKRLGNSDSSLIKERLISHKKLAQERTLLANERNFLAYIRTGLTSFALGFALIKLFEETLTYLYIGYSSLAIGICFILFGIFSSQKRKKKFMNY